MIKLPSKKTIEDKLTRHILYKPELFLQAYAKGELIKLEISKKRNIEKIVGNFVKDLQWNLRASYNSSSCLNEKQKLFLKDKLSDLLTRRF